MGVPGILGGPCGVPVRKTDQKGVPWGPGGSRHTIDMPRMYVASNSTSESTRQAARNIYVRLVFNDSGLSSASLGGFVVSSGHHESLLEAILSHRGLY